MLHSYRFLATFPLVSPTFPKLIVAVPSFPLHPDDSRHASVGCEKLRAACFLLLFIENIHHASHVRTFHHLMTQFSLFSLMTSPCSSPHPTQAAALVTAQSTLLCLAFCVLIHCFPSLVSHPFFLKKVLSSDHPH